jgi:hypothetical protein
MDLITRIENALVLARTVYDVSRVVVRSAADRVKFRRS